MEFDSVKFEQNLTQLRNSQQSIQSLSSWCTENRSHHKKIVTSWLNVLKQVKIDQRLILFNLANDVIQNSKRKNYEFVGSWGTALQRATTMVRDDPKVKQKIARIFKIWEERSIYNEEFLSDLNGLLNTVTAAKRLSADNKTPSVSADPTDADEFQSTQLIAHVNSAVRLQEKTDKAFKQLSKAPDVDVETIRASGKDREHVEGIQKEVTDSVTKLEHYIHSMKAEIKARNILIAALGQADEFYRSQRGDVKTVAIAYRNFGLRIKTMKKKLDELTTTLPSPCPSPDINAPSPPPDADLDLPDDNNFSSFLNGSAASSFLGSSQLPFDISDFEGGGGGGEDTDQRNPIQVISDGGYSAGGLPPQPVPPVAGQNRFNSSGSNANSSMFNQNQPQMGYNPSPVTPIYGQRYSGGGGGEGGGVSVAPPLVPPPMPPLMNEVSEEYTPSSSWNAHTNTWTVGGGNGGMQGVPPPMTVSVNKAPASPPFFERKGSAPVAEYNEDAILNSGNDVDQRGHINPLLSKIESRLLDVDHRNLISLTGSPGGGGLQQPVNTNAPPPMSITQTQHQKPGLLPTPPAISALWQQPPPQGINTIGGGGNNNVDSDFRTNYMQSQGIPPPPMPPVMGNYYGNPGNSSFGNFNMGIFNSPKKQSPQGKNGDNVDSVDMEMSDEEQEMIGGGPPMDNNNGGGGAPFMNFPPPGQMSQQQQQGQWANNGIHDSPGHGNNNGNNGSPWNNKPHRGGGFSAGGGPMASPMFRPQVGGGGGGGMNPLNFRGRGGYNRGGGGGPPPGNGMFRSPFRGNFRGNRGGGGVGPGGMW